MKKILYFLKKNALVILISFSLGGFAGYKVLESLGIAFLLSSIPIPEGSIADKDAFIETLPEGKPLSQKAIIPIKNKPKTCLTPREIKTTTHAANKVTIAVLD